MKNLKILIVDDDYFLLTITEKALKKAGYDVGTAHNGDEALDLISRWTFDVIITDMVMPGTIDGIALLEAAKSIESETEIIIMTSHATVDNAVNAMKKGAADYLQKPINFEELKLKLEKIRHVKSLIRDADDLREAMDVTESKAAQTIRNLEMMVADLQRRLDEMEKLLSDKDRKNLEESN